MRNIYSKQFESNMISLAPFHTLDELLTFAKKQYKTITKKQLRLYLSKRKIRYKDFDYARFKRTRNLGDKYPIGSERIKPDGMVQVKVAKDKWDYKQRVIYSKYYNIELTSDDYIVFLDQDRTNFDINNLARVTRRESSIVANQKLFFNEPNLTKTGIDVAKLIIKTKDKRKEKKMRKPKDETGKKYGMLTVLEYDKEKSKWKCQCDCGNITYQIGKNLRYGFVKSCGCNRGKDNWKDLTRERFGRLIAKKYLGNKQWECQCDCGNVCITKSDLLVSGHKKSCGCWAEERTPWKKYSNDDRFKRLYRIWQHMKERCYRKESDNYKSYGEKGIKVCDEWKDNFGNFFLWSINNGYEEINGEYKDKMSIDRIDSNKDYSPDNCRWITISENVSRINERTRKIEEVLEKSEDEMIKKYLERKMENNLNIQRENKKVRDGFFIIRKNNYCVLINEDENKKFLFKNFKTVAMFLNVSRGCISYRIKNKNGILTNNWKLEKISKEQYINMRKDGIEVII